MCALIACMYACNSVSLPPNILRRVKALKNIQKSTTQIEADFYKEVQRLEAKYHKLYQPFYDQRKEIVVGTHEPSDAECHWCDDDNETGMYVSSSFCDDYSGHMHIPSV